MQSSAIKKSFLNDKVKRMEILLRVKP